MSHITFTITAPSATGILGGNQNGDLGNKSFVDKHIKNHGALGKYFVPLKGGSMKMGNTLEWSKDF